MSALFFLPSLLPLDQVARRTHQGRLWSFWSLVEIPAFSFLFFSLLHLSLIWLSFHPLGTFWQHEWPKEYQKVSLNVPIMLSFLCHSCPVRCFIFFFRCVSVLWSCHRQQRWSRFDACRHRNKLKLQGKGFFLCLSCLSCLSACLLFPFFNHLFYSIFNLGLPWFILFSLPFFFLLDFLFYLVILTC